MTSLNKYITILIILSSQLSAGTHTLSSLPLLSVLPFVGILLSIAIFPLVAPHFWEENFGKIAAFWAALFFFPFWNAYGTKVAFAELYHVIALEYIPFIIILF